ncbi:hypothetical protein V4U94_003414 [Candida albicans]
MNSIDYSYPQKFVPTTVNLDLHINIPKDTTTFEIIQQPIYKQFTNKTFQDPLNDILKISRQKINNYQLSLPEEEEEEEHSESELESDKENDIVGVSKTVNLNQSTPIKKLPPTIPSAAPAPIPLRNKKSDNLACHADNILRMAIDSTIISSNSFTINSFEEDDDDEEGVDDHDHDFLQENSLIQLLKYKNSKRELRFKPPVIKFDINADDINSVL